MGHSDEVVMIGIVVIAVLWAYFGLRKWLHSPLKTNFSSVPINKDIKDSVAVQLMERDGYDVVGGKVRIPFYFLVNNIQLDSRLFVDYVARRSGSYFLVKVARDRTPMDWTASSVRNKLLPYFLLYSDIDGILYVDEKEQEIHQIHFQLEEE
ncbi:hypothetical protein BVG16_03280 [Paenibacillus selenitireducens]|uniref:Uncharacterized protein n=1 Tax=Paenibacillus selenitireducens TaxID=1324314 RepID=A0A1T2XNW2_9BACL|nr:hypothetical protein [Paenibacillus selenitireducens]OPA81554.1 hypothetical protein BVG16_03280 [Paenibacillus selenitireducens]